MLQCKSTYEKNEQKAGPPGADPAPQRVSVQSDPADPLRAGRGNPGAAGGHLDHGHDLPGWPAGASPVQRPADRPSLRPATRAGWAGDPADRVLRLHARRPGGAPRWTI